MPETPDFDQIAIALVRGFTSPDWTVPAEARTEADVLHAAEDFAVARVAEQLRQVWNARGAADMAKVTAECLDFDVEPNRAIRSLDR